MSHVALTDHGRSGGLLKFNKACIKQEVKPILGVELYVAPESRFLKEKLKDHTKVSYHLTILAKNKVGLENVFELSSRAWTEGFYYRPRVDMELLKELSEGLVVLSGCGAGRLSVFLMEDRFEEAADHAQQMRDIWGKDFYIEMQNHDLEWQRPLNAGLRAISKHLDIPLVVTQDSHYPERKDAKLHNYICKLAAGDLEFDSDHSWFKSYDEICDMFEESDHHAIHITEDIAKKCEFNWEYGKTIWPVYNLPSGVTPEAELTEKTWRGLNRIFNNPTQEYKDRLEYELGVINKMGFATYFLVVADFLQWARNNGIPTGPGRGSAAGSLVTYCIGITNVDPIKYGLYFQRFLNEARVSLPDIDCDICKERRYEVIQYVAKKYGANKLAQIGTYAVFKPRGSLRSFARVCGYEPSVGHQLASLVPPDIAGRSLSFKEVKESTPEILKTDYQDVVDLAERAEGLRNQAGVHAAGVLISDSKISRQLPLFKGKGDEIASQFDMHDAEEIGLVKYDFLGLKNLTIISRTLQMIKENYNEDIDIDNIEDENKKVYTEIFHKGKLDGVFQFEGSAGFKDLCIKVRPNNIEDLSAITALYRPGPLGCGLTDQYIACRNGKDPEYFIPELEPILKNTYGALIYQEQIMRICTDIAGYTLPEADNMRKIIGKKLPEKMKLEKEKFISGCINNNVPKEKADELFEQIQGFAAYGFNKSHSVAYSTISYQTAWLKAYYPKEFYTVLLNTCFQDQDSMVKYIHAAREEGIDILPPDINTSDLEFTLDRGTIVFGLAGVKGLGQKACEHLIQTRKEIGPVESLDDLVKRKVKKDVITALAECGALESITEYSRNQITENIQDIIDYFKKLERWKEQKLKREVRTQERLDAIAAGKKPPRNLPKLKERPEAPEMPEDIPLTKKERLDLERKTLGFYLTGHPLEDYPGLLDMAKYNISDIQEGATLDSEKLSIPIVVSSVTEKRSRKQQNYAVVEMEDITGRIQGTIFSKSWDKLKPQIEEGMIGIAKITTRKTIVDKESAPIINIAINNIKPVAQDTQVKITNIELSLSDGTEVVFHVGNNTNTNKWKQAVAYVNNLKRMGCR